MANIKNLAVGTVATAPSPATSGLSLVLTSGHGARFPSAPFYVTAFPSTALPSVSNAEILYVTAVSTDTLTITRAQKSTSAQSIAVGWVISNSIYTEDLFTSSINVPETLTGTPNGVLTTFTTSQAYTMLWLYKNGVFMYPGAGNDYTYSGSTVTFTTAPATGARLTAIGIAGSQVMISGSNNLPTDETPTGSVNSSNTSFTTSRAYVSGTLEVFINGVKQKRSTHFTETTPTSGAFTMSDAPTTGDDIMVNYQYASSVSGNAQSVNGYGASATPTANQLLPLDSNARLSSSVINPVIAYRAYLGTSQTGASGAKVNIDTVEYDQGSNYSTVNKRFTAPIAGIYHFSWNVHSGAATQILSGIYKNGSAYARGAWVASSGGFVASSGSTDVKLVATDYIELFCIQGAGTVTLDNTAATTYISGYLIGAV